ncbi:MAG: sulfurtransferase [Pseudomonadota bacterium]
MSAPLIEPVDLNLDIGTVVFDCRFSLADMAHGRRVFEAGHIPGAQRFDMETELSGARSGRNGRHPLPTRTTFEQRLRAAGVNNTTKIVLYDGAGPAGAARAWWLLQWFGFNDVAVLHGGFAAWQQAELPIETGAANAVPVSGQVCLREPNASSVVFIDELASQLNLFAGRLIDAREAERYRGEAEPIDPVAGRIPGAVNLPWGDLLDADGRFLDRTALREHWQAAQGAETKPVLYCGSGVTACVLALSRAVADLPPATLYAGGFSEWCADPARPVASSM